MPKTAIPPGTPLVNGNLVHIRNFLRQQEAAGKSKLTIRQYKSNLRLAAVSLGHIPFEEATTEDLLQAVARPTLWSPDNGAGAPPSRATRKHRTVALGLLYDYLADLELIAKNPTLKLPKLPRQEANPHPIQRLHAVKLMDSELSDANRVAWGLGLYCSLRRNEFTNLRLWQVEEDVLRDVECKQGKVRTIRWRSNLEAWELRHELRDLIPGGVARFEEALWRLVAKRQADLERAVEGKPKAEREAIERHFRLLDWRETAAPPRVPAKRKARPEDIDRAVAAELAINPDRANDRFRRDLAAAGVNVSLGKGRTPTPHWLRHGYCTYLIAAGVAPEIVSEGAGHTSIDMTIKVYTKLAIDAMGKANEAYAQQLKARLTATEEVVTLADLDDEF